MGDCGPTVPPSKAQATGITPLSSTDPEEVSVLVTGFGPFKTNLVNASYLIASSLPQAFDFPSSSVEGSAPSPRRVSIHVHPAAIPVAYSTVRTIVPEILEDYAKSHGGRRPDIVIHMGIAATRSYYSVETQAHRDSYHLSDVKGRIGYEDGEMLWRALKLPPVLRPGHAMEWPRLPNADEDPLLQPYLHPQPPNDDLLAAWKSFAPSGTDVRISDDAGRYLCEFIFYTSLAQALQEGQHRNVVFFHVPGSCRDEDIQQGRDAAIGLIKALVACWINAKA
ncbi:hypothetical protein BDV25DRAFT_167335 [Aspergillus avenaceus]|uniref:Peptidase n=1 Tax=Aspergillus avenaceus TaxID=36643 RepID=A0A5N6TDK3_ASPAV|nr:hypothetical protein BDV25DRAFT_167335 [Aspergillus avenaceus]